TQLEDPLGQPFSQAGGHPFAYRTEFILNYTTADDVVPSVSPAGGPSREVLTELPPGLVGNVENFPQCPMQEFLKVKENRCPANTAVGYAEDVAASAGKTIGRGVPELLNTQRQGQGEGQVAVQSDKASSLIYNLQPSAGEPAELGLYITIQNH